MDSTFIGAGLACIIAAIAGGGLKAFGIEVPAIRSRNRQIALAALGILLLVVGVRLRHPESQTRAPEASVSTSAKEESSRVQNPPKSVETNANESNPSPGVQRPRSAGSTPSTVKSTPSVAPRDETKTSSENLPRAPEEGSAGSATQKPSTSKARVPMFEGELYRISAVSLRKTGRNASLLVEVEGLDDNVIKVRICGWYLLDENGERWDQVGEDSAGLCDGAGGGVDVKLGVKLRSKLEFKPREPSPGKDFTVMGSQLEPWPPGKQIVIAGVVAE